MPTLLPVACLTEHNHEHSPLQPCQSFFEPWTFLKHYEHSLLPSLWSCTTSVNVLCTTSRSRMCYAPNSYLKMYNAPNLDLEICHASYPHLHYAPNPDLGNVSCTKSRSRNVSCIRSIMCYAPNSDLKMCHAMKLTDPSLLARATISYK
jgi:hypothetical protein